MVLAGGIGWWYWSVVWADGMGLGTIRTSNIVIDSIQSTKQCSFAIVIQYRYSTCSLQFNDNDAVHNSNKKSPKRSFLDPTMMVILQNQHRNGKERIREWMVVITMSVMIIVMIIMVVVLGVDGLLMNRLPIVATIPIIIFLHCNNDVIR